MSHNCDPIVEYSGFAVRKHAAAPGPWGRPQQHGAQHALPMLGLTSSTSKEASKILDAHVQAWCKAEGRAFCSLLIRTPSRGAWGSSAVKWRADRCGGFRWRC